MNRYLRALRFGAEIVRLAFSTPRLLAPLGIGLLAAGPVVAAYGGAYGLVPDRRFGPFFLAGGMVSLYFVVRITGGIACSLFHDHASGLRPDIGVAVQRAVQARGGLLLFGLVALPLEPLGGADWDRGNPLSRLFDRLARAMWTTSSYRILPSLVVRGQGLRAALQGARARDREDPTGLGAAYVGVIPTAYVVDLAAIVGGYALAVYLEPTRPWAGVACLAVVGLTWLVVDLVTVAYLTFFDLWAEECAKKRPLDRTLAQPALARVLPG